MIYGADYLGGIKFKDAAVRAHPQGWAAGTFLHTFGNAIPLIESLCATGKVKDFVIHLAKFDYAHAYPIDRLMPGILYDARQLNAVANKYPNVDFLLSPFCEHNHDAKKMTEVFTQLRRVAPNCNFVNSIWKGQIVPGVITEVHVGETLPRAPRGEYTVSFDGCPNMTLVDMNKVLKNFATARHIRWWDFRMNGIYPDEAEDKNNGQRIPIEKRSTWPDEHYLRGHNAIMGPREGTVTWPENALWKSFAEDTGTKDGKANKAMCIIPSNASSCDVLDRNGTVIDRMRRLGSFNSGKLKGSRYYSTKYAYQLGDQAARNTGSRLIQVRAAKLLLPLTDADIRSGQFR